MDELNFGYSISDVDEEGPELRRRSNLEHLKGNYMENDVLLDQLPIRKRGNTGTKYAQDCPLMTKEKDERIHLQEQLKTTSYY